MTYGEFTDVMRKVAEGVGAEAEGLFEEWHDTVPGDQIEDIRKLPLGEGEVRNFVEDMATMFREVVGFTDGVELYASRIEEGHSFLRAIRDKCVELGIDVSSIEIDVPLSSSDALSTAQACTA